MVLVVVTNCVITKRWLACPYNNIMTALPWNVRKQNNYHIIIKQIKYKCHTPFSFFVIVILCQGHYLEYPLEWILCYVKVSFVRAYCRNLHFVIKFVISFRSLIVIKCNNLITLECKIPVARPSGSVQYLYMLQLAHAEPTIACPWVHIWVEHVSNIIYFSWFAVEPDNWCVLNPSVTVSIIA